MQEQSEPIIEVRHEPDDEAVRETCGMAAGRPLLSFEERAPFGRLWVLSYLDNPCSPFAGVDEHLFPGDLTDLERVYREAQDFLRRQYDAVKRPDPWHPWPTPG